MAAAASRSLPISFTAERTVFCLTLCVKPADSNVQVQTQCHESVKHQHDHRVWRFDLYGHTVYARFDFAASSEAREFLSRSAARRFAAADDAAVLSALGAFSLSLKALAQELTEQNNKGLPNILVLDVFLTANFIYCLLRIS